MAQNYWIFQYASPVPESLFPALGEGISAILEKWKAHGTPLDSAWHLFENQIVYIALTPDSEGASGCSIDSLRRQMTILHASLGLKEADAGTLFYKTIGGLESVSFQDLDSAVRSGRLQADTLVADTTSGNPHLPHQLFRPLAETWLKRYLVTA